MVKPNISLSVLTKPNGILTKRLSLENGFVKSDASECKMNTGLADKVTLPFDQLPQLLAQLSSSQCITTGWVDSQQTRVELMSRGQYDAKNYNYPAQHLPHGTYATRTLDSFTQEGQSLIMFDYDDDPACPHRITSPEEFIHSLSKVIPNFDQVSYIRTYSSSSAVFNAHTNECIKPANGFHLYMVVNNGKDLQRFGEALEKRLWLAGYGYIKVSKKSASLLTRTIVDTAVFSPERLVFEAGAVIADENIYQKLPHPEFIEKNIQTLNTESVLSLTEEEERFFQSVVLNEKNSDKVVAEKREVKHRVAEELVAKGQAAGKLISLQQARRMVDILEKQILPPFQTIYFEDGTQATVLEIVANPAFYDGKDCLDPLREDKGYGKAKVYANLDQAMPRPQIHSFVEGGRSFDLMSSMRLLHVKTLDEELTSLQELVTDYTEQNSRYFQPIELKPGINLIKGEKGTGKTYTIAQTIKETELSVLGVTPRILLTKSMSESFGLSCYNDDEMNDSHVLLSQRKLAVCYDSLHKLAGQHYDIVIIDEIIQVMRHVKSSSVKYKFICLQVLRTLIMNARYVVMMDADISADYLQLLKDPELGCCKANMDIHLVVNTCKPAKEEGRKVYNYIDGEEKPDETAWSLDLIDYVENNGTLVATNSKAATYTLAQEVLESWGLKTTVEQGHFITEHEGRRVITITSDNSGDALVTDFIKDINQELRPTDVLLASPSLGTGVSVDAVEGKPFFSKIFGRFTKRAGNTSADCSQHIARIRQCHEYHLLLVDTAEWQETEPDTIVEREIFGRVKTVDLNVCKKDLNFDPNTNRYVFADNCWGAWFGQMTSFENIDRNEFGTNFLARLEQEGYTIEVITKAIDPALRTKKSDQQKRIKQEQRDYEVQLTIDSPLITDEEKAELDKKTQLTIEEKRLVLKKHTADTFGEYNKEGLEELLSLSDAKLKYRRQGLYFGMNPETLLITDLANRLDSEKQHIEKTVHYNRWSFMKYISSLLGVTIDTQGNAHYNDAFINDGVKSAVYNVLYERRDEVKVLFGRTIKYHKEPHSIATVVGNFIKDMGMKTKRENFQGPNGRIKVPKICMDSLSQLSFDIKRAQQGSPRELFRPLEEVPHVLMNYVAQLNAGTPHKAAKEHRYLSALNEFEANMFQNFVERISKNN